MDMEELLGLSKRFGDSDILNPQDKELFESSGLEEVKQDINAIQSLQEMTQTMMNMTRLDPFLTGMTHFERALVAVGFQETQQVMAYVWGPVRFLFKVITFHVQRQIRRRPLASTILTRSPRQLVRKRKRLITS